MEGSPYYHLWYLYMVVGLFLAAPFLRPAVAGMDSRSLGLFIVICFTIAAIESALGFHNATFMTRFIPFIGYFLAGHHLRTAGRKHNGRLLALVVFLCGSGIALGTGALIPRMGPRAIELMYGYLNPAVIAMSLSVYLLFANAVFTPAALVHQMAKVALGIYLIHPLWLFILGQFGLTGFFVHPLIGIPLTTILAFALSVASAALLAKIPVLRRTVC